jgi:hypothetical protein
VHWSRELADGEKFAEGESITKTVPAKIAGGEDANCG